MYSHQYDSTERSPALKSWKPLRRRDTGAGVAPFGDTKSEALRMLAEALELHEGGGEPISNPDEFLRDEFGIDPPEAEKSLLDFLQ